MATVKYSGLIASFHCPTNAEIRSLKVHFSPKQEGSGDPSPENVREIVGWDGVEVKQTGKNIGHIVGYSATTLSTPYNTRNITNSYGTSLNTIEPERSVVITQSQAPETSTIGSYKNGYIAIELDNLLFGESYDISFKISDIKSNPLNATLQNLGIGDPSGVRKIPTEIRDNLLIYKNVPFAQREQNPNQMDFDLRICGMSFTLSDFMITPSNTSDGVFESYQGSTTDYEFGVLGKNKWDEEWEQGALDSSTGNIATSTVQIRSKNYIPVVAGETYYGYCGTLSGQIAGSLAVIYYDADHNFVQYGGGINGTTKTIPDGVSYIKFWTGTAYGGTYLNDIAINYPSTATEYEPYSPNHTVYGGWVDLITGEVQEEWSYVKFRWGDVSVNVDLDNYDGKRITLPGLIINTTIKNNKFCNIAPFNQSYGSDSLHFYTYVSSDISYARVYLPKNSDDNTMVELAVLLDTPITYSLAPTQLQTFLGQNNVWSNADYVEVEYDLHETQTLLQRKAFIMANQPHLATASGALAQFKTDVRAPLKECRVYFNPVQEGTGDPSPSNVRAISGWKEVEVYRSGKNLFDIDTVGLTNKKYIEYETGTIVSWGSDWNLSDFVPIKELTDYTLQCYCTGINAAGLVFYNENQEYISGIKTNKSSSKLFSFTTPSKAKYMRFSCVRPQENQPMLVFGTLNAEIEFEPYDGTTIPIDWTNEAGTLYSGHVNLVSGELVAEKKLIKFSDISWTYYTGSNAPMFYGDISDGIKTGSGTRTIYECSAYNEVDDSVLSAANFSASPSGSIAQNANRSHCRVLIRDTDFSDAESFAEARKDVTLVYKLATPITYTLTPTQLKTLHGINNIWSDANGNMQVKFFKH